MQFTCDQCNEKYETSHVSRTLRLRKHFCSLFCSRKHIEENHTRTTYCELCKQVLKRRISDFEKSKTKLFFCNSSCAATYNNTHKKHGTRVSKLELFLQEQLVIKYPDITFIFNSKDAIKSELDIYLPELKLAFELNGIFHYEPIYGNEQLQKIQNNDNRKFQACLENKIELVIIDSSSLKYFKPIYAQKYLDIISTIINKKLSE